MAAHPTILLDSIPPEQLDDWGRDLTPKDIKLLAVRSCLVKSRLPARDLQRLTTLSKLIQHIIRLEPQQHKIEDLLQALTQCHRNDVVLKIMIFMGQGPPVVPQTFSFPASFPFASPMPAFPEHPPGPAKYMTGLMKIR